MPRWEDTGGGAGAAAAEMGWRRRDRAGSGEEVDELKDKERGEGGRTCA